MAHPDILLAQARARYGLYPAGHGEETFLMSEIPSDDDNLRLKEMWSEQAQLGLNVLRKNFRQIWIDSAVVTSGAGVGMIALWQVSNPKVMLTGLALGLTAIFTAYIRGSEKFRQNNLDFQIFHLREMAIINEMRRRYCEV